MRRNVRNVTLVGFAALVLGGVAVAASGAFDSTPSDAVQTADAVGGAPTTMAAFSNDAKVERVAAGGAESGAATIAAGPAPAPALAAGGAASDAATQAPAPAAPDGGAKIVKTADLTVSIAKGKFTGAFAEASRIATANGGFVVSSSTSTTGFPGGPIPLDDTSAQQAPASDSRARAGQLTIRVPAAKFDATRAALAGLGDVDNETINGQDVSSQLVDLGARITSLKAEEQAFQTLLGKATAIGDVLQIQDQLFNVRTQIEELQAQQASLDDQATFSTITVSLYEPGVAFTPAPESEPSILSKAWDDATGGALNVLGGMVVVLGYAVPLAALAVVGWGVWALSAPWRRRRRSAEQQLAVEP
jgi:Domain of unknown function (DUF4349)